MSHNLPPSPTSTSPTSPTFPGDDLVPTIDKITQECPRFRVLIVGRSGVGKSSLINAVFKTSFALVEHNKAGYADVNREITSPYNDRFVLHDSQGYEPGDEKKFNLLEKFIYERSRKKRVADRLHAIWLCISVPYAGGRIFETGDEKIFKLNRNKVPIIVVFTKYDLLVTTVKSQLRKSGEAKGSTMEKKSLELAAKRYEDDCVTPFKVLTRDISEAIPYVHVSISQPDTLASLVDATMRNISVESYTQQSPRRPTFSSFFNRTRSSSTNYEIISRPVTEDFPDSAQVALAAAQRVHLDNKISASIKVGRKKYWSGLVSGMHFFNRSLAKCILVLHKDIIGIWNIRDLNDYFLSELFRARMTTIVDDLSQTEDGQPVGGAMGVAAAAAGIAAAIAPVSGPAAIVVGPVAAMVFIAAWAYGVYHRTPANIRCLMGYVVDLTIIMQAVFRASLMDKEGRVAEETVKEIVDRFGRSEQKRAIHDAIRAFVQDQNLLAKADVVERIEALIQGHRTFSPFSV